MWIKSPIYQTPGVSTTPSLAACSEVWLHRALRRAGMGVSLCEAPWIQCGCPGYRIRWTTWREAGCNEPPFRCRICVTWSTIMMFTFSTWLHVHHRFPSCFFLSHPALKKIMFVCRIKVGFGLNTQRKHGSLCMPDRHGLQQFREHQRWHTQTDPIWPFGANGSANGVYGERAGITDPGLNNRSIERPQVSSYNSKYVNAKSCVHIECTIPLTLCIHYLQSWFGWSSLDLTKIDPDSYPMAKKDYAVLWVQSVLVGLSFVKLVFPCH